MATLMRFFHVALMLSVKNSDHDNNTVAFANYNYTQLFILIGLYLRKENKCLLKLLFSLSSTV